MGEVARALKYSLTVRVILHGSVESSVKGFPVRKDSTIKDSSFSRPRFQGFSLHKK